MEPAEAVDLANTLADELNAKFMAGLGYILDQSGMDPEEEEECDSFRLVFVGGSHASRIAAAADRLGLESVNLGVPGFRVSSDTVENQCSMLQDVLFESSSRTVIIYQLLDNNVFFKAREDGSCSLTSKNTDDNTYHINGRLEYVDHTAIKSLVNTITPLLRAGGECEKIILSPLPRYMMKRCCKDRNHLVNKREDSYASDMGEALADMRDSMKDLIFGKKIRNFKVLSTTMLFMDDVDKAPEKLKEFWKDDPVHMTAEGYEELVTAVSKVISTATFNRPAHGRPGKSGGHHAGGRGGSRKRSQWVCEDDTVAHRRDEDSSGGYKKFCGGRDQPHTPRGRGAHRG
jgi:lysophospholipase L1-like esterase